MPTTNLIDNSFATPGFPPMDLDHFSVAITAVLISMIFGCIGGLTASLISDKKDTRLSDSFIGAAGALGFMFVTAAIGGLDDLNSAIELVRLISTSVIAGFGAKQLLPLMVSTLEKQIEELKRNQERMKKDIGAARNVQENIQETVTEFASEIKNTKSEAEDAWDQIAVITIDNLKKYFKENRDEKTFFFKSNIARLHKLKGHLFNISNSLPGLWIDLAIAFRRSGDTKIAIEILNQFLERRDQMESLPMFKENLSAAYYNLACYTAIDANTSDIATIDHVCSKVLKYLDQSIDAVEGGPAELSELMTEVDHDEDFEALKTNAKFKEGLNKRKRP